MNLFDLTGKNAIVTGGNRGLGKGMAEALSEAGAKVAIWASSESVHTAADDLCNKGGSAFGIQVNLGDREAVNKAFKETLDKFKGHLDILVNDAGVQRRNPCEDFTFEDWDTVININLNAVFQMCQLAGRQMLKQGGGGKIINLASMLSFFGGFTVPAYAASKGGVAQLTKAFCNEWASKGICVNAIAPGYMDTDMNVRLVEDKKRNAEITARIPIQRWGTPEDVKGVTVFLASKASDYINGAIIPVDGGYLVK